MADKPAPEEKKTPAAEPAKPPAAEPAAAKPAPAQPPATSKQPAAGPAPAAPKAAESKVAQPAAAKPPAAEPAAAQPAAARAAAVAGTAAEEPEDRDALRAEWADEAQRTTAEHDKKVRRFLLRLSLANWGIAIVAWTISAFLGITSPASIIVYSVLFVIGLVAAILAILLYLLEKFGHEPRPIGAITADEDDGDAGDGEAAAAKGDTAAPAAT